MSCVLLKLMCLSQFIYFFVCLCLSLCYPHGERHCWQPFNVTNRRLGMFWCWWGKLEYLQKKTTHRKALCGRGVKLMTFSCPANLKQRASGLCHDLYECFCILYFTQLTAQNHPLLFYARCECDMFKINYRWVLAFDLFENLINICVQFHTWHLPLINHRLPVDTLGSN